MVPADEARRSVMPLLPLHRDDAPRDAYQLVPTHPLPDARMLVGAAALWRDLAGRSLVAFDAMPGVDVDRFVEALRHEALADGRTIDVVRSDDAFPAPDEFEARLAPYLGGDDPIFGRRCELALGDLFDAQRLEATRGRVQAALDRGDVDAVWVVGGGAAVIAPDAAVAFLELPKNEVQYRARAGRATNLGRREPLAPKVAYKRSYFVDWPVFERHKADLLPRLDWIVDTQRDVPVALDGDAFRAALGRLTRGPVRARPWFEPGAWGGQWMKRTIPDLPEDPVNYAWSFELISPENGIVLEAGGTLLEVAWEWWMAHDAEAVLGPRGRRFGRSFPIRFDFLDTVEGGNLSVQVHPRPDYIEREFGEPYTQDETYYILDADPDAEVYLGLQETTSPERLETALRHAERTGEEIDVRDLVQVHPARRHDLFLIPSGTVHCSGRGNLVLEISATPYIFTFKLYDWQRLDLDGAPRPLNVDRGLANVRFDRRGAAVRDELVSTPRPLRTYDGGRTMHLPTHREHFFDVHRHEFDRSVSVATDGSCHVLNLVAGDRIRVRTADGQERLVHYAETFVVPAAAGTFDLVNEGATPVMVVDAFLKADVP